MEPETLDINMDDAVSAREADWVQACKDAAQQDDYFRVFRSSEAFRRVIEGTPKAGGVWNLRRLLQDDLFIKTLPFIQASDTVGLPQNMIDFTISGSKHSYSLSPTTIRYANNAISCLYLFGKDILNGQVALYEIGSGYGGECKIFNDFATTLYGSPLADVWHIYDLPSSQGIINRFLSSFSYSASFKELSSHTPKTNMKSLVLSNGAFSEMRGSLLSAYFDKIIAPATFGYFITNFETHSAPHGGWTTSEFIERLQACGKKDVTVLPTSEYLSYFDQQAGSKLIVFGHTHMKKNTTQLQKFVQVRMISLLSDWVNILVKYFIAT